MEPITSLIILLTAALIAGSAYFANQIYKYNKANKDWTVITFALLLLTLEKILLILKTPFETIQLNNSFEIFSFFILPLIVAMSFFWGLRGMKNSFSEFSVIPIKAKRISKNIKNRLQQKSRKRK